MTLKQYATISTSTINDTCNVISQAEIESVVELLCSAIHDRKPVLICGNGGSACDADHFTGELVGRFLLDRRAFSVISLSSAASTILAVGNDFSFAEVFARQVEAYGEPGGVLVAITTSGKSQNIIVAIDKAKQLGMKVVVLTGRNGEDLHKSVDHCLVVDSSDTPYIQQTHEVLWHYVAKMVEEKLG